jgi:pilus assembly protein CpaB
MRNRGSVLISVVLGLLAVVLMWTYVSSRERQLLELAAMRDTVIASRDIPANSRIDETMIQVIQVPAKYAQPKAMTDAGQVVGRVSAAPISQGAQVTSTSLVDARQNVLASDVPRGMRALTIAVSDVTGVGGLVRAGDFVDVIGTFEYGRPIRETGGVMQYSDERTETITLMQNVQVVAVGQQTMRGRVQAPPPQAEPETDRAPAPQDVNYQNVTVLVGPKQVQDLILAQQVGTLTLALRAELDSGTVTLDRLDPFGLLKVQVPVKPRPTPIWREIRGSSY